jgi:hypothetical protein
MQRSALAAIVLLAILLLSAAPADAHSSARSAPRQAAELMTTLVSPTHDGSPCCPDGTHGPVCCPAGACSLVGCLAVVEPAVFPATPEKLAYDLFEGSRPDGAGIAPDLPPPRAIV